MSCSIWIRKGPAKLGTKPDDVEQMIPSVEIRIARVEDVEQVLALALKSFGAELTDRLIYGSSGFPLYMRAQLELPGGLSDTKYIVALADQEVAGFVEILCRPPNLFLNYIVADKEKHIKGLGSFLLKRSLELVGAESFELMILDVFSENSVALRWYLGLGFEDIGRYVWWEIPLPKGGGNGEGYLCQLPQAKACQERFGFACFQVRTSQQAYDVGMLGEKWFRVTCPEILEDDDALDLLASLDKSRRLLAIFPAGKLPVTPSGKVNEVATALRLSVKIPILVRALESKQA